MTSRDLLAEEVGRLNREWMQSYVRRDVRFLERYLADDYISTFPDGTTLGKQAEIEALRSGAVALSQMTPSEMMVRVYDRTAVITGRSTIKAAVHGQDETGEFRFIDVWTKGPDGWKAVASQVTRIAAP